MAFTSQEIKEVYRREIIGKRAGNNGTIPLSMCDREGDVFSKVKPLGHGFMFRDVVRLHKNPKSNIATKENESKN